MTMAMAILQVILIIFIASAISVAILEFYYGYTEKVDNTLLERFCSYFENKGKQLAEKRNRRDKE